MGMKRLCSIALTVVLCSLLLSGALSVAVAAIVPPGCNTNNFSLSITRDPTKVHDGDTVLYEFQADNLPASPPKRTCDITGVTITFYPPMHDGTPTDGNVGAGHPAPVVLEPGRDFPVGSSQPYGPVSVSLSLDPGVTLAQARVDWIGNLQDSPSPDPQTGSKTVTVGVIWPCISVEKTADTSISKVGDTVNYQICVANCGDDTLDGVTVNDSLLGDLSGSFADSLAPGASECHTFPYVVQQGDSDPLVNTVEVSGVDTLQQTWTDSDEAIVDLVHPSIDVTKEADAQISKAGDTVNYEICVTNTGDVALHNLTVSDTIMGDLSGSFADSLEPGASECHTFPYVVQPGDPDPLPNTVTVHANPVGLPNDITDNDTATVDLVHPCLEVDKTVDTPISKVGDTINYQICITNCGEDIALENISVVDSLLGDVSGAFADSLGPGASECHTFPYVVQPGDPDPLPNTVTVHANPVGLPNDITDDDTVTVDLVHPSIDITKTADGPISKVGDTINYEICVTNTGDVALHNLTVTDTLMGDLSASYADSLAPGASECHTFSRTVQPGDPDPLPNTVTVHANPVGLSNDITDSDTATVDLVQPGIEITKTADTEISKVGDTVNYEICVTNTGNIALENVAVTDTLMGDLSGSYADSLAPGASECHTFPYVVQPGDPDPLPNTATVHSNPVGLSNDITDSATETVDLVHPSIDVTKTADTPISKVGDTVNYQICVTNTGDIALHNLTVADTLMGDLSGSYADSLAPGASECHTFSRTVQPGDPDPLPNTATVHANPVGLPNDITDSDTETVDLVHPSIDVTKTADGPISKVGDTINYQICVYNTGDVTLHNLTVADSLMGDLSGSYDDSLEPGASECHSFPYVVQPGDPDPLPNTATVHANPVGLPNDISDEDTEIVDLVQPGVEITKTADTEISKVGDTINYEICVTNTGTVALEQIVVTDTRMGDLSGSYADSLAPGASECHTFPYVVQPGDPDPLPNTATVHSNPVGLPNDITDSDTETVDLVQPSIEITKTADTEVSKVGDTVNYEICVTNTGNIALENVVVTDTLMGNLSGSYADSLAPGATECHTFPYVVQASDPDPLPNTATVHANPVGLPNDITDSDTEIVDLVQPGIEISKTADTEISKAGDAVNYEICVTNTGSVTLEHIVVTDTLMGDLSGSYADSLAPGASECHTFSRTVQASDPDPLVNTATVHANPVGLTNDITDSDAASVDLVHPSFTLDKTCSPDPVEVGGSLTWTITVANSGDIGLSFHLVDPTAGLDENFTLAASGSQTFTPSYVVQPGDTSPVCNTADLFVSIADGLLPNTWHEQVTTCCDIEVPGGPTRTPGYWFTHPTALNAAFACITGSETGVINLCDGCSVTANDAMAIFWNIAGSNRPTLAQHILSAMFNQCVLGTVAPDSIIENGMEVLCNPSATSEEIAAAIAPLDAFNNSGDALPFPAGISFGSANPRAAKAMANAGTVPGCVAGTP